MYFLEEVTRQLNYCVRDGLLQIIKRIGFKGSKVGVETEGYKIPTDEVVIFYIIFICSLYNVSNTGYHF